MDDKIKITSTVILCLLISLLVDGISTSMCEYSGYKMACKQGSIPLNIPSEISELHIDGINLDNLQKHQFKNVQHIKKLVVQAENGETIPPKAFSQFTSLTDLRLQGKQLRYISEDAFLGLNNLQTLNLSSNPLLRAEYIGKSLSLENRGYNPTILPKLRSLSFAKVQTSILTPVDLDKFFLKSVADGRCLKYLDISNLNIFTLNFSAFEPLCKSLEVVDIRKTVIGDSANYEDDEPCKSLRTLDISGIILPMLRVKYNLHAFNKFCNYFSFFTNLEIISANYIITETPLEIDNYTFDMSKCPMNFQKITLTGNKFRWLNITVHLNKTTKMSLLELHMSNNAIEYMSPSILSPSENIRILDFSNNNLQVMQIYYSQEFEKLFWAQTKLRYLDLSFNSLSNIPRQMFSKNVQLKVLNISHNLLHMLDFVVFQFTRLEKLNVGHNRISIIEPDSREKLDSFFNKHLFYNVSDIFTFHVSLEGNKFQCRCETRNMKFIEWLHSTAVIDDNETLTCELNGNSVNIRDKGLKDTKQYCELQTVKKVLAIVIPVFSIVVTVSILCIIVFQRRRKKKLMIRRVINQIEMGTFPLPHLVFLSYCNEDNDLVKNKIYPELCEHLSEMTSSDELLVCIGDTNFRPGFPLHGEVMRCVEESSVFIAVISRNFCRRRWCNLEIEEAYAHKKPIIMLMAEHVEKDLMDDFLQKIFDRYAHASWKQDDDGGHIEPEWKLFCKSIIQLAGKSNATAKHFDVDEQENNV